MIDLHDFYCRVFDVELEQLLALRLYKGRSRGCPALKR